MLYARVIAASNRGGAIRRLSGMNFPDFFSAAHSGCGATCFIRRGGAWAWDGNILGFLL